MKGCGQDFPRSFLLTSSKTEKRRVRSNSSIIVLPYKNRVNSGNTTEVNGWCRNVPSMWSDKYKYHSILYYELEVIQSDEVMVQLYTLMKTLVCYVWC